MKLNVLAVAVAASLAFPMAAQADLKISGDIGLAYDSEAEAFGHEGSELNLDANSQTGSVTYMGHAEVELARDEASDVKIDEIRVGAKGGFGEVWLGDVDNACDQFDPGPYDEFLSQESSSCRGNDAYNLVYKNKINNVEFAVSHNPNEEESAIGMRAGMGPVKVNLGYEKLDDEKFKDDDIVSYGIKAGFNNFEVNAEGNDDDEWGFSAKYAINNNTIWAGTSDEDDVVVGYHYDHGNMKYVIEHYAPDEGDSQTKAGVIYSF